MSKMDHNIAVAHKNESEIVDCPERPLNHESHLSLSSKQPNEQAKKNDIVVELEAMITKSGEGQLSPICCIYRVPPLLRKLNQEAYTPKAISIGPFHHGHVRLQNMEGQKLIFFKRFIDKAKKSLNDLVKFAELREPEVRACYSEKIKLSKKELVKVILVDAGFIIELFMSSYMGRLNNAGFTIELIMSSYMGSLNNDLRSVVLLDLLLLENQLPFFFLEGLFNTAFPSDFGDVPPFRKLTCDIFRNHNKQKLEVNHDSRIKHFTDLLRLFYLPREEHPRKFFIWAGGHDLRYSASELYEVGLKFKINTSKCLLDLKFSERVLEIPKVMVDVTFEIVFCNMIALEQCQYPFDSYITDYARIMDCLVNTSKDVEVLIHEDIIDNGLADSNDVVNIFNGLSKGITAWNVNSYDDICQSLNKFYKDPLQKLKETLRRDYCKTPWQTAASIAAIVLLILTLVQSIFSILDFGK